MWVVYVVCICFFDGSFLEILMAMLLSTYDITWRVKASAGCQIFKMEKCSSRTKFEAVKTADTIKSSSSLNPKPKNNHNY